MKTSSRKNKSGRKAAFPLAENELHSDFLKLRQEGQAVKSWWFKSRAKQLVKQHYPNKTFRVLIDGYVCFLRENAFRYVGRPIPPKGFQRKQRP